jgi:hypothetical protein
MLVRDDDCDDTAGTTIEEEMDLLVVGNAITFGES